MWNLSADDVRQAIEELKGRRAAIQARYDADIKKLEAELAEVETFERFAVKIVSDYLSDAAAPAAAGAPAPAAEAVAAPPAAAPQPPAAEANAEPEPAGAAETQGGAKGSSRWRMRLGAGEAPR